MVARQTDAKYIENKRYSRYRHPVALIRELYQVGSQALSRVSEHMTRSTKLDRTIFRRHLRRVGRVGQNEQITCCLGKGGWW